MSLIVAPVALQLGSVNVRAIENSRQINQQQTPTFENSYTQTLEEIVSVTNEFNALQRRDLEVFNNEYCQVNFSFCFSAVAHKEIFFG